MVVMLKIERNVVAVMWSRSLSAVGRLSCPSRVSTTSRLCSARHTQVGAAFMWPQENVDA